MHLFTVKSDSCYNVPWLCSACAIWSRNFGAADHAFAQVRPRFFLRGGVGGGGGVRLTAKPRYLLLLHRGNKKSNTVTALLSANHFFLTRDITALDAMLLHLNIDSRVGFFRQIQPNSKKEDKWVSGLRLRRTPGGLKIRTYGHPSSAVGVNLKIKGGNIKTRSLFCVRSSSV